MVDALILYYMVGIPFLTVSVSEKEFPKTMEFRVRYHVQNRNHQGRKACRNHFPY
jgi:hypothetical protein